MSSSQAGRSPLKLLSRFGTLFVLLLLCIFFSIATLKDQHPTDEGAARTLASRISRDYPGTPGVLIVVRPGEDDLLYATTVEEELKRSGANILGKVTGKPSEVRKKIEELGRAGTKLDVVATHNFSAQGVLAGEQFKILTSSHPSLGSAKVLTPPSVRWPVFLKMSNLMLILNMISVIAIIAIGMTMVIITTGIDLSVGSLIAFSGVIVACSARELGVNPDSGILLLIGCVLLGIAGCGLLGAFSGVMVTAFGIHPFIVTLSIMSIARGMSFIIADGPSDVVIETESYRFLGGESSLMGIPNSVILMMLLYVLAHLLMTRTVLGRHIYAVGGNREAAHLSGVPVKRVLIIVYTICGALAGLGGVVNSSLHGAGSAKSGLGYELQIIAAVVVGGTSLAGGSGNIMGTLVGALILGVIANGMNLTGVTTYPQMVVFGLLILVAVLIDQLKNRKTGAVSG